MNEKTQSQAVDIAAGSWLEKWPAWLRWILFFPAAVIVSLIASTLFLFVVSLMGYAKEGTLDGSWYRLMQSGLLGALLVYIGSYVAPKYQFAIGIGLLVVASVLMTILMTLIVVFSTEGTLGSLAHVITVLIGASIALYTIYQQSKGL